MSKKRLFLTPGGGETPDPKRGPELSRHSTGRQSRAIQADLQVLFYSSLFFAVCLSSHSLTVTLNQ